jgi:hypothetical protein
MDAPACDEDQFSVPVVDPRTGRLYVAFENFNTPGTVNQYLVVRSDDGGQTSPARSAPRTSSTAPARTRSARTIRP